VQWACFVGWSDCETPFVSRAALDDFIGRYREAGIQRFVFSLANEATPDAYRHWIAAGGWATREILEGFAAETFQRHKSGPSS
jgi:hypothetical protein